MNENRLWEDGMLDTDQFWMSGTEQFWMSSTDQFGMLGTEQFWMSGTDQFWMSGTEQFWMSSTDQFEMLGTDQFGISGTDQLPWKYRDADKSLARPRRKQANVSVRMAWNFLRRLACAQYITVVLISP